MPHTAAVLLLLLYLYLRMFSGWVIAGGFQVNCSQVAECASTCRKWGGEVVPRISRPPQARSEAFTLSREEGREVPFSLRETTKMR